MAPPHTRPEDVPLDVIVDLVTRWVERMTPPEGRLRVEGGTSALNAERTNIHSPSWARSDVLLLVPYDIATFTSMYLNARTHNVTRGCAVTLVRRFLDDWMDPDLVLDVFGDGYIEELARRIHTGARRRASDEGTTDAEAESLRLTLATATESFAGVAERVGGGVEARFQHSGLELEGDLCAVFGTPGVDVDLTLHACLPANELSLEISPQRGVRALWRRLSEVEVEVDDDEIDDAYLIHTSDSNVPLVRWMREHLIALAPSGPQVSIGDARFSLSLRQLDVVDVPAAVRQMLAFWSDTAERLVSAGHEPV